MQPAIPFPARHATATRILCKIGLLGMLTSFALAGNAQSTPSANVSSQDCAKIDLPYPDSELFARLTREEKITWLDKLLLRAVSHFEPCPPDTNNQAADSSGGLQNTASATDKAIAESTPASDIQGDDALAEAISDEQTIADHEATTSASDAFYDGATDATNSNLPADIPSSDSDDIIAQQFRQAAIEETDRQTKHRLWNEYRRYKGLPELAEPET